MAKRITKDDVNKGIKHFLETIIGTGASTKGHSFDQTVLDTLKKSLPGAVLISSDRWCNESVNSIFAEHKKRTAKNNYDFSDLDLINDNGKDLNLIIVDKPNGSQKWPDILVIFNGMGLPIEVKSSKSDNILWNSGIPKNDGIYIFNCYGKGKTTCFLGQHVISDSEREFLIEQAVKASKLNKSEGSVGRWGYYARAMYNSNQTFFEKNEDKHKEEMVGMKGKLANLKSKMAKGSTTASGVPIKTAIATLEEKIAEKDQFNKDKKASRISAEKTLLSFIGKLTWDHRQRGCFNEDEEVEMPKSKSKSSKI